MSVTKQYGNSNFIRQTIPGLMTGMRQDHLYVKEVQGECGDAPESQQRVRFGSYTEQVPRVSCSS